MRKNHHGKKDRLVKRVFALCLALAVICTCLVPVFATEDLIDPQVNQEASRPVDDGEDNLDGGPTVTDSEWGTVIDYSTSTSTDPSTSTETQWSGEDDVVEKPDDKVVVSGDEIKKLQDMVVYRFWLKELNANDLQDITAQAQINNMTESEYLARNGEVLWNLYFIQAVLRAETIADYSSYIENPSSNRDPKGELRQFDYWYTLDEFGNRVRLNLTDPTSNILDDKTTTVNVYAAWKDGTVGSDEEEDVDHEDLVDKNPVPVDLTAKASTSYEDEDGNTKSVNLPVEVKNLPSATHRLSVTHMGDHSMTEFCNTYVNELQGMQPLLGLKITPEDINSEKVQLAKGQKATVTVSGLNELPDIAEMEEMGALNADALKVLHQKNDGTVEKLDVVSYENGTLTFETSSFSPFVIALEYPDQGSEDFDDDGIEIVSIEIDGVEYPNVNDGISTISSVLGDENVPVGATIKLRAKNGNDKYYHYWEVMPESTGQATLIYTGTGKNIGENNTINVYGPAGKEISVRLDKAGKVVIRHTYGKSSEPKNNSNHDKKPITVVESSSTGTYNLYVYTQVPGFADDNYNDKDYHNSVWNGMSIGKISGVTAPSEANAGLVYSSTQISDKLGKEIVVDSGQFPVIPILQDDKKTYVDYYYETDPRKPDNAPYYTIDWYRVVVSSGANTGKNGTDGKWESETLKNKYTKGDYASPISPVNGNQYHLDGKLHFHDNVHINVDFKVQDAGKTGFELEPDYTAIYKTDKDKNNQVSLQNARRPDTHSLSGSTWVATPKYPKTKEVGNITYRLYGWYTDEACTNEFNFATMTINTDTTFYAKYVPASANLTVTKTVTGKLGDTNKAFTFTITKADGASANIIDANVEISEADRAKVEWKGNGQFTLKDGASITFKNLPSGEYKILEEDYTGEKYETSWQIGTDGEVQEKNSTATVTIGTTEQTVHFTNHRTLEPDLGVLLDTLPYIVILAVVAGGGILLMLRKRRKEDD